MLEALSLDVQARASALQRAQLNNSALANNPQGAPGPLNNTAPISAVAINQSALNNSALNAQNAALNNSALNRSALSGQPARQTLVLNTSAHNRSAFDNKMTNPIIRDSPIGPLTNQPPQYQSNLPGEQFPLAQRELSGKLTIVFWLAVVLLLVEMFIMLGRYHFLSLLVGLAVIGLFALNMFSTYYNRCVLAALLVSIGFDIAWLVIKMHRGTQYPGFYSPFASLHTLVNMAVVMFIFLSIFLRVMLENLFRWLCSCCFLDSGRCNLTAATSS